MTFPDPKAVIERTAELLGGRDRMRETIVADFADRERQWKRDVLSIGRILRAHLYVEHYLTEFIERANPRLGSMTLARLTYWQKVALLDPHDPIVQRFLPGIKHLNVIRNRLAHKIEASITKTDSEVFLSDRIFRAMAEATSEDGEQGMDPLSILEFFARSAAYALQREPGAFAKAYSQAFDEIQATTREQPY